MYGSGTWTLSQKDVNMTDSLEGKIFRPTQAKRDRESRHKKKICELYDDVTCYTVSCVTRLHYAAHTVPPQKGGGGGCWLEERRPTAKRRSKWEDGVWKDAIDLHQTCKWMAGGWRKGWRKKTREAMAQQAQQAR